MLPTIMPEASKNSYNHRKDSFMQTAKASKISIITVTAALSQRLEVPKYSF